MADINLLPQEEKARESEELWRRRLKIGSIGFLVVSAVLTTVTLGLFTVSASKRANLVAQVEETSSQIESLRAQEELLVVVKDKAATAGVVLGSRTEYASFFEKLASLVPEGVYFTELRVDEGRVVLTGKAKTSAEVAGLVSSLVSVGGAEVVSDLTIDSLSSNDSGEYGFVMSAQIVGQAVAGE